MISESKKEYNQEYHKKNKNKIKAKAREYYLKNKEKKNAQSREYREKHREELINYGREYRKEHREELRTFERERYPKRKEWRKEYSQKPEVKARINASRKTPKFKAYLKGYRRRPEVKAKRKEYLVKTREQTNATARKYLESHPQLREHYKTYRRKARDDFISAYKKGKCCELCGYNEYPEILQFHHKNPKMKSYNISNKIRCASSIQEVKSEVDKCILLCPNCHSWLHFNENKKKGVKQKLVQNG